MIKSFSIKNVATFDSDGVKFDGLKKANFILGANGTGKTTISNAFYNWNPNSGNSNFIIEGNINNTDILVYNKQFRKDNFKDSSNIPGVFTLGKNSIELEKEINDIEHQINVEENNKEKLNNDIDQLDNIIENNEKKFDNYLWEQLLKPYKEQFISALGGIRGTKDQFKNKILESHNNKEIKCNQTHDDLLNDYNILYNSELRYIEPISNIPLDLINKIEEIENQANQALREPIVATSTNQMTKLIDKLKNTDWVRSGMEYIKINDTHCPFCQQEISQTIINNLKDVFDETYQKSIEEITKQQKNYTDNTNDLISRIDRINTSDNSFKDSDFSSFVDSLKFIIKTNELHFRDKLKEPSNTFEIKSATDIIQKIYKEIQSANEKIEKNNKLCENAKQEKERFQKTFLSFLSQKEANKIEEYLNNKKENNKLSNTKNQELLVSNKRIQDLKSKRSELRKEITNIINTAESINSYLESFGFNNFKIKANDDNSYSVIRNNNEEVKDTLSEGEITFITFLYYYHLINGDSNSESSNGKKILIIDDPVSSLDSNVLFIVSTLLKDLIKEVVKDYKEKKIMQLFIFTHNNYFLSEITSIKSIIDSKPGNANYSFWILRKVSNISKLEKHGTVPRLSDYKALWKDIIFFKNNQYNHYSNVISIRNNMRRILEHYFKFLGQSGNIQEQVQKKIQDRQDINNKKQTLTIIDSLFNWMNSGSHNIDHGIEYIVNDIDVYLKVFEKIFTESGHLAHYEMMMNSCSDENTPK